MVLKGGGILPRDQVFASREEVTSIGEELALGSNGGTDLAPGGSNGGTSLAIGHVKGEEPTEESLRKKAKTGEPSGHAEVLGEWTTSHLTPASTEVGQPGGGVEASVETDLMEECGCPAFARKVASWLDGLNEVAKSSSRSTPALLAEKFPLTEETRAKMLEVVPWDSTDPYKTMLQYPRAKCKGILHITCFDYGERGLHGKGIYAGSDAALWLHNFESHDQLKRIDVVPVKDPGTDGLSLSHFGYGTDGKMLNATVVFAIVSAVLYSIESQEQLPGYFKVAAGAIKVQYNAHATGLDRLVSNMLVSNLHASVNRSMDDPLLLANELGRHGLIEAQDIRNVMKSYKVRLMSSPNLALKKTRRRPQPG